MKTTQYELVFGQPPRQNIFPGASKSDVMEEDIEDILREEEEEEEEEEESPEEGQEKEENDSDTNENGGDSDLDDGKNQGDKIGDDSQDEENELNSLATTQKHRQLREEADKHYRLNAERMKLKYSKAKRKKVLTFSEGDFVSVRIPRIDRSSTDFHRLPCVVVERLGSSFYLYRLRY